MEKHENNETLSEHELDGLEALYQICDFELFGFTRALPTSSKYISKLLEISNNFAETSFFKNSYEGFTILREDFPEIITDEGVCYTLNMLDFEDLYKKEVASNLRYPKVRRRSNWTVFGYEDKEDPSDYPFRSFGSGRKKGVSLKLRMRQQDVDYTCKGAVNGFRILLHTPDELPKINDHYYKVPFDVETMISVEARAMSTTDNLKRYKPIERQCFFTGEKQLNFFKSYTLQNCKLECLTGELDTEKE